LKERKEIQEKLSKEKYNKFINENMKYDILTNRPNTSTISSSRKKSRKNINQL
jgi:hypothetical protein